MGTKRNLSAKPLDELISLIREGASLFPNEKAFYVFHYDTKLGHLVEPFQEGDVLIVLTPTEQLRNRLMEMVRVMGLDERCEPIRFFAMHMPHREPDVNRAMYGRARENARWMLTAEESPSDGRWVAIVADSGAAVATFLLGMWIDDEVSYSTEIGLWIGPVKPEQRGLLELAWLLALEDRQVDSRIGSVLVDHLRTVGLERIAPEHRAAIGVALAQQAKSVRGIPTRR